MRERSIDLRFLVEYPGFRLDVALVLSGRGVTALFGPSGSGKTTLLRCIAGFARPSGWLRVNGSTWQDDASQTALPTHRRPIGMVFQEPSLFAHLTVRDNLEFGWKRCAHPLSKNEFDAVVDRLDIRPLLDRRPSSLSGGERQRVAIGRALAVRPELLLLDEPLSSLDVQRKQEILPYLERLRDELDVPMVFVSHSLDEVARLADHLVLLNAGRVIASGPLATTLARLDLPTSLLDDAATVIEAVVAEHDAVYQLTRVAFSAGELWLSRVPKAVGAGVRVRVHAGDVSIALVRPEQTSVLNIIAATVRGISDVDANRVNVQLDLGATDAVIVARITRRSRDALALAPGTRVFAQIKSVALL